MNDPHQTTRQSTVESPPSKVLTREVCQSCRFMDLGKEMNNYLHILRESTNDLGVSTEQMPPFGHIKLALCWVPNILSICCCSGSAGFPPPQSSNWRLSSALGKLSATDRRRWYKNLARVNKIIITSQRKMIFSYLKRKHSLF